MSVSILSLAAFALFFTPQDAKRPLAIEDRRVAGGPEDFMEVRHLRLAGSNFEIGKYLTQLAVRNYRYSAIASDDPLRARAQRLYFDRNYPILLERMRGVAAALGKRIDDDRFRFSTLFYSPLTAGCSVVFYPPSATSTGDGILSRYYDFSTGTLRGAAPPKGQLGATARPWLLELHPDRGYASIAMVSYDLLGVIDGMNEKGLCVALLADGELMELGVEQNFATTAGLGVLQVGRMLLDTCKNVEEAKVAMLANKHYYSSIPCHYLICDAHGKSFLWEHSLKRNREHVIDGKGAVQITTNFMLHRHRFGAETPPRFNRWHALRGKAKARTDWTIDQIKEAHSCVAATQGVATEGRPVGRTLWHGIYRPEKRSVELSFYLGDRKEGGRSKIRRSAYRSFRLAAPKKGR